MFRLMVAGVFPPAGETLSQAPPLVEAVNATEVGALVTCTGIGAGGGDPMV